MQILTFESSQPMPLEHFDISLQTGFIPTTPPEYLPSAFDCWERAFYNASQLFGYANHEKQSDEAEELWRERIHELPIVDTRPLEEDRGLLQRAHLVLAFLVHYYVHSIPMTGIPTRLTVPKALAVPLTAVSKSLGIAPVLTYADVVLWNVGPINSLLPFKNGNIRSQHVFSGTEDEREFYLTCAQVELRGVELLQIIQEQQAIPVEAWKDQDSINKLENYLVRTTRIIEDLSDIMQSVRARCDPHVFYNFIRPWWKGCDANGPASPRWIYEGVDDSENLDLSGPSAGQTSVIHALDIWLGVDHKLLEKRIPEASDANRRADRGFMERMRRYMPGLHRHYLQELENSPRRLRNIVRNIPALHKPYDEAVLALKHFRDVHLRIAVLYTISASKGAKSSIGPVRGTGGTDLVTLLKGGRDASARTVLSTKEYGIGVNERE